MIDGLNLVPHRRDERVFYARRIVGIPEINIRISSRGSFETSDPPGENRPVHRGGDLTQMGHPGALRTYHIVGSSAAIEAVYLNQNRRLDNRADLLDGRDVVVGRPGNADSGRVGDIAGKALTSGEGLGQFQRGQGAVHLRNDDRGVARQRGFRLQGRGEVAASARLAREGNFGRRRVVVHLKGGGCRASNGGRDVAIVRRQHLEDVAGGRGRFLSIAFNHGPGRGYLSGGGGVYGISGSDGPGGVHFPRALRVSKQDSDGVTGCRDERFSDADTWIGRAGNVYRRRRGSAVGDFHPQIYADGGGCDIGFPWAFDHL